MAAQEVESLQLKGRGLQLERLLAGHVVEIAAAQMRRHMVAIAAVLVAHAGIHLRQVGVAVVVLTRPFGQAGHHTLQVPDSVVAGLHAVVAQVFGL